MESAAVKSKEELFQPENPLDLIPEDEIPELAKGIAQLIRERKQQSQSSTAQSQKPKPAMEAEQ